MKLLIVLLLVVSGLVQAETFVERVGQPDKVGHYATGATITAAGAILLPGQYAPEVALGLTAVAAVGKELYDARHRDHHTPEVADAAATVLGGALVYAAIKTDRWMIERRRRSTVLLYRLY